MDTSWWLGYWYNKVDAWLHNDYSDYDKQNACDCFNRQEVVDMMSEIIHLYHARKEAV